MRSWFTSKGVKAPSRKSSSPILEQLAEQHMDGNLENTLKTVEDAMADEFDFIVRRFHAFGRFPAALIYYSSMIDQVMINHDLLKPLMQKTAGLECQTIETSRLPDLILNDTLYHSDVNIEGQLNLVIEGILCGNTALLIEGLDQAFIVRTCNINKRAVDQPATEQVIRGPREGFIEILDTNIALIRYRLQTPDLRFRSMTIGRRSKSRVAVCFIQGITSPELVDEVEKRLSAIDIDAVLDSGYLEQFIEDNHYSPFPQVQYTERPDKVAANLLEGRIAILVNGSPLALMVPTVFNQFYQTVEDYTERFVLMSAIRVARFIALVFSLIFPSLYVSIISFNPELIPTEFAVAVAGGRAGVPWPAVVEVLIIEISMEVLREATIRLPQQVGGALSIVGVLVIGQAAVAAGFASPITVVIIALTTIGSFATPAYNAALALRLLRFPLIIMAGIFGLYGVMIGFILIANHMLSLKSFGVPYLSPIVPGNFQGMKDTVIRAPLSWMKERPSFLMPLDKTRIGQSTVEAMNKPVHDALDPMTIKAEQSGNRRGKINEHNDQGGQGQQGSQAQGQQSGQDGQSGQGQQGGQNEQSGQDQQAGQDNDQQDEQDQPAGQDNGQQDGQSDQGSQNSGNRQGGTNRQSDNANGDGKGN
ncbi:spore germination protein [Paenibacillus lycopersici]|uniref:Spore germination protein n=1 Tax=Paenibacillus lycopersici TaxID=2704462 RepID=A0A6C0G856_9BACL|nr:spore germination protein [Paenibacillus lycopersici]